MARTLTAQELDKIAPVIEEELKNTHGKDKVKKIANKYKLDQSLIRSIARTRKTGMNQFVPNNTVIDIPNNDVCIKEEIPEITVTVDAISTTRKQRVDLTAEQKEELYNYYKSGEFTREELAEVFNVSIYTVGNIIRANKKEDDTTLSERKQRVIITDDIKKSVINDYLDGATNAEIAENNNLSIASVTRIIKAAKEEDKSITMSRRNVKTKKKGSYRGNNHQRQKERKKYESKYLTNYEEDTNFEEAKVEVVADDVVDEVVYSDTISFCGTEYNNEHIKRLIKPVDDNFINVGMIAERHDMGDIPYIFNTALNNNQMNDIAWQESIVDQYITDNFEFDENGNSTKYMNLYCTGLQVVLGSIIRACIMRRVNLNLNHYVASGSGYLSQVILDQYGSKQEAINYPFEKMHGNIYTYDCDLSDITNSDNLYCMSLNKHQGYKDEFDYENCSYIIFKNDEHIWELYPQFVKMCQNSKTGEHNSVLLSKLTTSNTNYWWGDNISKSFNYK